MRSLLLSLAAVSIAPCLFAADRTLPVHLTVHDAPVDELTVVVRLLDANGEVLQALTTTAPARLAIESVPSAAAVLTAEATGFWSSKVEVSSPSAGGGELGISLWREATVQARLSVPRGLPLPESAAVRIGSPVAQRERSPARALEPTTIECPVDDDGHLHCGIPALPEADLRFRVPGFASRFFWGLELTAGQVRDLGTLRLLPGASVVGRVEAQPPIDVRDVVVVLESAPGSPYEPASEGGVVRREARPDRRGFFAVEGLRAGVYRLLVEHPELQRVEVAPVRVVDGAQTELADPVVLRRAERLRLSIQPPFDPFGADWTVRFHRIEAPGRHSPQPAAEATATAGFVPGVMLAPGPYRVTVLDSRGARLAEQRVEHEPGGELHTMVVEAVRLQGTVRLGEEPLVARLTFQGPTGAIQMESDAEGRFEGARRTGDCCSIRSAQRRARTRPAASRSACHRTPRWCA